MNKRIFTHKKKKDPSLNRIIFAICTILAIVFGVAHFAQWFNSEIIGGEIRAKAPETLEEAQSLFEEGNIPGANKVLQPLIERVQDPVMKTRIFMLRTDMELSQQHTGCRRHPV